MFIVGQALFETGMANKIGSLVTRFAKTERQCIIAVMLITGLMSGFLSNTGTAAVLIPVVIGIAASSDFSRGKLLMPLVFAAALGGNLSIIGAPGNLIGTNALNELGIETGFFEYIGVGLPMLVFGILYLRCSAISCCRTTRILSARTTTSSPPKISPASPSGSRPLLWSSSF